MRWDLEQLATEYLEFANLGPPVDPEQLAIDLGLVVEHAPGCEGALLGDKILVDESIRMERRAFAIGHELGHYILRENSLPNTEANANYLASAILLPRDDFERDLRRVGWDLLALQARHRFASNEAIARRIVALREARAFIFDRPQRTGARENVYSIPWGLRPSAAELDAAKEALRAGAPVETLSGVYGWPVIQHDWHRAVTVAALDSLAAFAAL